MPKGTITRLQVSVAISCEPLRTSKYERKPLMKKSILLTAAITLLCGAQVALAATIMPNTPAECNNVQTWLKPAGNTVLATPARIKAMNKAMLSDTMCDLWLFYARGNQKCCLHHFHHVCPCRGDSSSRRSRCHHNHHFNEKCL